MLQYQQQQEMHNLNNYGSSQLNWPTQNTNSSPSYFSGQQQENVPDFADLVSWMLAEDFIDSETLAALLTQWTLDAIYTFRLSFNNFTTSTDKVCNLYDL